MDSLAQLVARPARAPGNVCYNEDMRESLKNFVECLLKDPSVQGGKRFMDIWKPFSKKHEIDFPPEEVVQQLRKLESVAPLFDREWDPKWGIYLITKEGPPKSFEVFRTMGGQTRDKKTFHQLEDALTYKISLVLDEVGSSLVSLKRM